MGLKFKGDKTVHKKKRSKLTGSASSKKQAEEEESGLDGWVVAPSPALLLGPSYIRLPAPSQEGGGGLCIALQPTTGKVYPFQLPTPSSSSSSNALASSSSALAQLDPEELEALVHDHPQGESELDEPTDVHHVWVCTRVPDTNDKITLRSGTGKFLASDELGQVTADREARGPQEEWIIEQSESSSGRFVLKSMYGKYLGVDQVAGGKLELRCDGAEEGETERWRITVQGEYVAKAKKQYNERNGIKTKEMEGSGSGSMTSNGLTIVGDLSAQEKESILRYQARGGRKYIGTEEDTKELKRAKKEGKLSEAMLDRRTKLKSDRYC
ncbi:uncharacterized protein JCM6883_000669 [Sporobolomyces salmoneus]|uniref:uncharacterized protein n=1 Tax=Sporobolomyces salmoneus TaxID=183962 RepID=UPI003179006A